MALGIEDAVGGVTIDASVQFLAPAKDGRTLEAVVDVLRETRRMIFMRGLIEQDGEIAVSFTGVIKKASSRKRRRCSTNIARWSPRASFGPTRIRPPPPKGWTILPYRWLRCRSAGGLPPVCWARVRRRRVASTSGARSGAASPDRKSVG